MDMGCGQGQSLCSVQLSSSDSLIMAKFDTFQEWITSPLLAALHTVTAPSNLQMNTLVFDGPNVCGRTTDRGRSALQKSSGWRHPEVRGWGEHRLLRRLFRTAGIPDGAPKRPMMAQLHESPASDLVHLAPNYLLRAIHMEFHCAPIHAAAC